MTGSAGAPRKKTKSGSRHRGDSDGLFFSHNPLPMWVYDLDSYHFLAVNRAAVQQYGYSEAEFKAMTIKDIRPSEDVARLVENVGRVTEGIDEAGVWRHIKKDGSLIFVEIVSHVMEFDGRRAELVVAIDVTERQQAAGRLRASEDRYRDLVENIHDLIGTHDLSGNILSANGSVSKSLGVSAEALVTMNLRDLLAPEVRGEFDAYLSVIQDQGQASGLMRVRTASGETRLWEYDNTLRTDLLGAPIVRALARDVTERRRADATLRLQAAALEAAANAIVITDRDGTIEWVNPAFSTLTGYTAEESLGRNPRDLVRSGVHDRAFYKSLWETILAGRVWSGEITNRRKDGTLYADEQSVTPVHNASGRITHFVAIKQDVTERKRAAEKIESQLRRLAALRAIDAAIASSLDLRLILNVLLEQVLAQLRVDAAAVLLLNHNLNQLEYAAGRGFQGAGITGLRLKLGEDYAGQAALERRTIGVPNLGEAGRPFTKAELTADEKFRAFFAVPLVAKGQVKGVLEVFQRAPFDPDPEWMDFLQTLAGQAAIAIDDAQLFEGLQRLNADLTVAYDATIEGWSRALDLRDKETEGHSQRVTDMTMDMWRAAGMSDNEIAHVRRGALLHDIGKLGVPDHILLKPGPLTDDEWVIMRQHPQHAYELLAPIHYLRPALDIPYCHHEKWDGTGYPRGLRGEQIPLAARLFAVVDVWDALRSDRPYRPGWSAKERWQHIRSLAGTHFDPRCVDLFAKTMGQEDLGGA